MLVSTMAQLSSIKMANNSAYATMQASGNIMNRAFRGDNVNLLQLHCMEQKNTAEILKNSLNYKIATKCLENKSNKLNYMA